MTEADVSLAKKGSVRDTCKKWSQGDVERKRLRIEGIWQVCHIENEPAEAADMLADIGAEACGKSMCRSAAGQPGRRGRDHQASTGRCCPVHTSMNSPTFLMYHVERWCTRRRTESGEACAKGTLNATMSDASRKCSRGVRCCRHQVEGGA
jgi:hypothetical protein